MNEEIRAANTVFAGRLLAQQLVLAELLKRTLGTTPPSAEQLGEFFGPAHAFLRTLDRRETSVPLEYHQRYTESAEGELQAIARAVRELR